MHQWILVRVVGAMIAVGLVETSVAQSSKCPDTVEGYVSGEATADLVKSCLGKPAHEDHNPDGRYVYLYKVDQATVAFLFDSSGKLIRTRGYKKQ